MMAKKEELFEKETKYCKIIKSVTVVDGEETFALEKIYIIIYQKPICKQVQNRKKQMKIL